MHNLFCFDILQIVMKKVQKKIIASPEVRAFFSQCGFKGGSSTSKKKAMAVRKNGFTPCRPGKFRGRPKKQE